MKLHISNINGFNASKELLDAQTKISKVGIELGPMKWESIHILLIVIVM